MFLLSQLQFQNAMEMLRDETLEEGEESKSADEIVDGGRCEYCQSSKFLENMGIHLACSNRPTYHKHFRCTYSC